MKDYTQIFIIVLVAFLAVTGGNILKRQRVENYSNSQHTNYEQIPNYALYPNSIANAYMLNYQFPFPGPAISQNDTGKCRTY